MHVLKTISVVLVVGACVGICGSVSGQPAGDSQPVGTEPDVATVPFDGGWFTRGGEVRPSGHGALEIRVGFPSVDVLAHIAVNDYFEIVPYVTFDYVRPATWQIGIGNSAGVAFRFQVLDRGPAALALGFDVGVFMRYPVDGTTNTSFRAGMRMCAADLKFSYRFDAVGLALIVGLRTNAFVQFGKNSYSIRNPILLVLGLEWRVADNMTVHAVFEPGLVTRMLSSGILEAELAGQVGLSWLW